ncbi:hypothetical protein PMAYCL1PPCAC_04614 [Pristionchus mayeri]|uniref:BTB domain-containing protein n=1 Tax=Pristionchus mayeri TaxID=1317129 RepID=A0AAN4Z6V4_9BILA|nr:hypothetical protein PMAYCL1PPCAC_04614 [Pristionchus mayeri]
MGTDILIPEPPTCLPPASIPSGSNAPSSPTSAIESPIKLDRPFKIIVQRETFLIDSECLKKMSPIFNIMCYGKDFDKMELSREIVDEKSADVDIFLKAINDPSVISVRTFTTILRLANKYQVELLRDECEQFVLTNKLALLKPDEVLTLLLACHEHHLSREAMVVLIRRLAEEEQTTFNRLKLSRFCPATVYGAVVGANLNLGQLRELEQMNGHFFKMERNKTRWRRSTCDSCKSIMEQTAHCDGCKKSLCKTHAMGVGCASEYGRKMTRELRANIVELDWE